MTLRAKDGSKVELNAPVTQLQVVSTDPCVLLGTFDDVRMDLSSGYDACVEWMTVIPAAPGHFTDGVGSGWCD